jgi:hypothetical protein
MDAQTRTAAIDALMMALVALTEEVTERTTLPPPDERAGLLDHAERLLLDCEDLAILVRALVVITRR